MTSIFEGNPPKQRFFQTKQGAPIWVPGIYMPLRPVNPGG